MAGMLTCTDLVTAFLGPLSFRLDAGTIVALAGASGSGKSLLLRALADLDPAQGHVTLDTVPREAIPAPDWRRRVVLVPAESGWWEDRVGAHFPADPGDLPARLALPGDVLDWPVARLSTGERQRLALARAIALAPQVLLLDEPTSSLDPTAVTAAEAAIRAEAGRGAAVLIVTHDPEQARRLAGRRLGMADGRLTARAP